MLHKTHHSVTLTDDDVNAALRTKAGAPADATIVRSGDGTTIMWDTSIEQPVESPLEKMQREAKQMRPWNPPPILEPVDPKYRWGRQDEPRVVFMAHEQRIQPVV